KPRMFLRSSSACGERVLRGDASSGREADDIRAQIAPGHSVGHANRSHRAAKWRWELAGLSYPGSTLASHPSSPRWHERRGGRTVRNTECPLRKTKTICLHPLSYGLLPPQG